MAGPARAPVTRDPGLRLARLCELLNAQRVRYLVVGAAAMQLWGTTRATRATRDIDILVEPTLGNAELVLRALSALPFGVAAELTPQDLIARPVTRIGDVPNVDVLTRAWQLGWDEAVRDVTVFEVEGVPIPTVSLANLIASKRTGRTQDNADIELLEALQTLRARLANATGDANRSFPRPA